jgi:hypothetical protein
MVPVAPGRIVWRVLRCPSERGISSLCCYRAFSAGRARHCSTSSDRRPSLGQLLCPLADHHAFTMGMVTTAWMLVQLLCCSPISGCPGPDLNITWEPLLTTSWAITHAVPSQSYTAREQGCKHWPIQAQRERGHGLYNEPQRSFFTPEVPDWTIDTLDNTDEGQCFNTW